MWMCVCVCISPHTPVSVFMFVCLRTYRLMELRLNEPDFLLRVVQMIRSLKRKRERSFFPPTVFYRQTGRERELSKSHNTILAKFKVCENDIVLYFLKDESQNVLISSVISKNDFLPPP